jgi:putative ABC transport system ATP-binding protein
VFEPEQDRTVIGIRGLKKSYWIGKIEVPALKGVDLDLSGGEFVVFLGPSGSGKSTLFNLVGGLDTPSSGTIRYRGLDLSHADEKTLTEHRRKHLGFVFQFYHLIPGLTASENVRLVTEISDRPMPPEEALALVGLSGYEDRFPSELSGGEQQRVSIARAVAKRPDLLLCDEPTGALDCATGRIVLGALETVNRELGTLVAVITHNAAISGIAHRVVRIEGGRIASEVRNDNRLPIGEIHW